MPGAGQFGSEETVQTPRSGSQQVPSGCGHGLGLQVTHSPSPRCQTPGDGHSTLAVTTQLPSAEQQAPVGAAAGH